MCGRYTLTTPTETVAAEFDVPDPPRLTRRYNIAPSQLIAAVGLKPDGARRGIALLKWGLVPHWANDPDAGPKPINARAETVGSKFPEQFHRKRCLIPADGFYEWVRAGKTKRPCYFTPKNDHLFAFAGLWDVWQGDGKVLLTGCLITTDANELVGPVHDRMPVIVPRASYAEWLDPRTPAGRLTALLKPYPADQMTVREVGTAVNSPEIDGPECLEAA